MGSAIHGQMGLGCIKKVVEQAKEIMPVSSAPPHSVPTARVSTWLPSRRDWNLESKQTLSSPKALEECFITATEKQTRTLAEGNHSHVGDSLGWERVSKY